MHSLIWSITSRYQWIILTLHTQIQPLISSYLFLSRIIGKPLGNIICLSLSQSWRRKHNTAHVCEFRGQSLKIYVVEVRGICTLWMGFGENCRFQKVESSWNVMAHGDAREGKCRGNWRMEWVASTLHTTPEHGVSSITTDNAHTSAASSRMNWHPRRFKWTRPFRRKTKTGFCACAIIFQPQSATSATQTANGAPGAVVRTFCRGVLCLGMSCCFTVETYMSLHLLP